MIARRMVNAGPVVVPYSRSVLCDSQASPTISLINAMGMYDYNNMSLARRVLNSGGTFIDVGANIGSYTILLSECDLVQVLSFEPVKSTFEILQKNIILNRRVNVTAFNCALSDADGEVTMTNGSASTSNHVVSPGAIVGTSTCVVPARTLSAVLGSGCQGPIVIKIDVEGHELSVLKGAGRFLREAALVFVERGNRKGVREFIKQSGLRGPYYWDEKTGALLGQPLPVEEDAVFLGPSLGDDILLPTVEV